MKNLAILVYLKSRKNAKRESPIYLRVTVDGKRIEKSLNRSIDAKKWNKNKQRGKGNTEPIRELNQFLNSVEHDIFMKRQELFNNKVDVNVESLMNAYLGVKNRHTLVEIIEYENKRHKKLVRESTYKKQVTVLNHVKRYLKYQYKITDIDIKQVDYQFVTDFDYYLRTEKNISNNSTIRIIQDVRRSVKSALYKGWIDKDPFLNYKVKKEKIEKDYLTKEEIDKIYAKKIDIPRIEMVRDVFIFCCYTGLAYADVKLLNEDSIVKGIDGRRWIKINRRKTGTLSNIPILPVAEKILDKYKINPLAINSGKLLPVPSNQKMNAYLKEIGDICGIKKRLVSHMARYSFGSSLAMSNGVPIETINKVMGHSSLGQTMHYAKVSTSKISEDMAKLEEKLSKQNLTA
jgi:integrase